VPRGVRLLGSLTWAGWNLRTQDGKSPSVYARAIGGKQEPSAPILSSAQWTSLRGTATNYGTPAAETATVRNTENATGAAGEIPRTFPAVRNRFFLMAYLTGTSLRIPKMARVRYVDECEIQVGEHALSFAAIASSTCRSKVCACFAVRLRAYKASPANFSEPPRWPTRST